uniref:Plasma membrane proteolipid 3 n=1 Tax=Globodera rostochiensis TaxID=31243 RepID=A0A914HFE0_GLORO
MAVLPRRRDSSTCFFPLPAGGCLLLTFSVLSLFIAPNFASIAQKQNEPFSVDMSISQHQPPQIRAKRANIHEQNGFSIQALAELLLCFFLPPAAVALHGGPSFKLHILLNVVLCILGWIPGILHAVWYCFISSSY